MGPSPSQSQGLEAPLRYIELLIAIAMEYILFGCVPNPKHAIGIVLILLSTLSTQTKNNVDI